MTLARSGKLKLELRAKLKLVLRACTLCAVIWYTLQMSVEKPRSVPLPVSDVSPVIDRKVWYAEGLRFECTQCGNCCTGAPGYVWLTVEDMQRIAGYLKISFDDFTRTYVRQIGSGANVKYSLTEKYQL